MLNKKQLQALSDYVLACKNEMPGLLSEEVSSDYRLYEKAVPLEEIKAEDLESFVEKRRQATFSDLLFHWIDAKEQNDFTVYKKAGIDRRHFSKIRSNTNYHPGKNTAIALAMALELNEEEMEELIASAGYSLSQSSTFDLVIRFCLKNKIYNLYDINQALDYFSLKPLAGVSE
ncbi:MAG TPA: hypothetical protein DHN33_05005 [Eubacteriaceae bacterium]|nr:hypothetical protein [Eubacteriaceae bacterium]